MMAHVQLICLALLILQPAYSQKKCSNSDVLEQQDKTNMLVPAQLLVLIPHYQIQCSGRVSEWTVLVESKLHSQQQNVDLSYQIWRQVNSSYTLIGRNRHQFVYNTSKHIYSFHPETDQQIQVEKGDIIGLYMYGSADTRHGVQIGSFSKDLISYYSYRTSDSYKVFSLSNNSDHFIQIASGLAPLLSATVSTEPIATPTQTPLVASTAHEDEVAKLAQYDTQGGSQEPMSSTAKLVIPVVAATLTVLLIVASLSIVGAICLQVHKKRRSEQVTNLENPSYGEALRSNSYAVHVTKVVDLPVRRIPMSTRSDNRMSEHDYESVSEADDYIDPIDIKGQVQDERVISADYDYPQVQLGAFLDVDAHPQKSMKKQSAIYEAPHQFFQFPTEAETDEDYSIPSGPKNLPISPGYEVPMLKSVRVTQQPLNQ